MNASSDLSSAHSIAHDHILQELEKGFYAAPKIRLSQDHNEDWKVIRARLDHTLQHLFQPTPGVDDIVSREFLFAGESSSVLAPTVIIICCHESHKSQLLKILKKQPWLAKSKYRWRVIIDKIEHLSSSLSTSSIVGMALGSGVVVLFMVGLMGFLLYRRRRRLRTQYENQFVVVRKFRRPSNPVVKDSSMQESAARLPEMMPSSPSVGLGSTSSNPENLNRQTPHLSRNPRPTATSSTPSTWLCRYLEVLVPMQALPSAVGGCGRFVQALSASLNFTIGGILLIDGVAFGLTTQHAFRDFAVSPSGKDQGIMGRNAGVEGEHIVPIEGSPTQQQLPVISGAAVNEKKHRVIMPSINGYKQETRPQLDWALIAFDEEKISDLSNTIFVPSRSQTISVSSIVPTNEFDDTEVLITAGKSGLASGWLRSSPISMQSQNGVVEARQIILDRPLVPGDSGSWVLKDDKLYGHIFAKRTLSPIAYMLPIESIFEDIRWCLKANSITLVRSGEN
ncbi:hypothetical protein G7054_g6995 [Neopestalotiopsis clavispora]|nr:hypothetical protein G7054_g6995 [Neopestalotiopsis clavispora]